MESESELRENGITWSLVQRAFIWNNLSKDFIRQLVETDQTYKTQLEHHLIMAFHGYQAFPSPFYQNMYAYLKMGLAEAKDLTCYADRIYLMYREQAEKEWSASRQVYKFVDGATGRVLDTYVL